VHERTFDRAVEFATRIGEQRFKGKMGSSHSSTRYGLKGFIAPDNKAVSDLQLSTRLSRQFDV